MCELTLHALPLNRLPTLQRPGVWVGMHVCLARSVDGTSYFAILYFVLLVLTGPFFIVNLFLAVLKIKFADVGQHEKEVEIAESLASGMSSMKQHPSRKVAPDAASKGPGPVSESMLVALPEERSYHAGQTCPPSMREIEAASLTSADKRLEVRQPAAERGARLVWEAVGGSDEWPHISGDTCVSGAVSIRMSSMHKPL